MKTITLKVVALLGLIFCNHVMASGMPTLVKMNGCNGCHDNDKRVVGPSLMEVSKKYHNATRYTYKGTEYTLEDGLVMKVSKGGSGIWGAMPMPANDPNGAKQNEMREMVKFILNLSK